MRFLSLIARNRKILVALFLDLDGYSPDVAGARIQVASLLFLCELCSSLLSALISSGRGGEKSVWILVVYSTVPREPVSSRFDQFKSPLSAARLPLIKMCLFSSKPSIVFSAVEGRASIDQTFVYTRASFVSGRFSAQPALSTSLPCRLSALSSISRPQSLPHMYICRRCQRCLQRSHVMLQRCGCTMRPIRSYSVSGSTSNSVNV